MLREIQRQVLGLEQAIAEARGEVMAWTNIGEGDRQIIKAVAKAMTEEGLGKITVTDFRLRTKMGVFTGIKIRDSQHTDLSDLWRAVNDVREQLGASWIGPVAADKLSEAVTRTIQDIKSHELDKREAKRRDRLEVIDLLYY